MTTAKEFIRTNTLVRITGNDYVFRCPYCHDRKGKFWLNIKSGLYHCWLCGKKGKFQVLGEGDFKLKQELTEDTKVSKIFGREKRIETFNVTLPPYLVKLYKAKEKEFLKWKKRYPELKKFLNLRHIDLDTCKHFKLSYATGQKWTGRLIIPVFYKKKLVGYQARDVTGKAKRKYLNPPQFKKRHFIYNLDWVVEHQTECIIMEGPLDVMKAPDIAIALFGKKPSKQQRKLLTSNFNRVTIMLDADARKESLETARELNKYLDVKVILLKENDPGSMSEQQIRARRDTAIPIEDTGKILGQYFNQP